MNVVDVRRRLILVGCVAFAYWTAFAPSRWLLGASLAALHNPPYRGFAGKFIPHLLLYSTLTAVVSAILWTVLYRKGLMPALRLRWTRLTIPLGVVGGVVGLAAALIVVAASSPPHTIHWLGVDPWSIAGNIFSNFYEEFIFRGFALVALTAALGFWPAAIISSAMWAFEHNQYPLALQLTIVAVGVLWCWIARRANTLLAPYLSHMLLDIIGDALIP